MKIRMLIILLSGVVLLHSCMGVEDKETVSQQDVYTISTDSASGDANKLIKTAAMQFKVKDVMQTSDSITKIVAQYGGMIVSNHISTDELSDTKVKVSNDSLMRVVALKTYATTRIKLPVENLSRFISTITPLGVYINSSKLLVDDQSLNYLSSHLKQKNRDEIINRYKNGKISIKKHENVLELMDASVDEKLLRYRVDDQVRYSMIDLDFYQDNTIIKEIIANDNVAAYDLPFFKRLGMAAEHGLSIFYEIVIAVTNLWVLLLLAILTWYIVKKYRNATFNMFGTKRG